MHALYHDCRLYLLRGPGVWLAVPWWNCVRLCTHYGSLRYRRFHEINGPTRTLSFHASPVSKHPSHPTPGDRYTPFRVARAESLARDRKVCYKLKSPKLKPKTRRLSRAIFEEEKDQLQVVDKLQIVDKGVVPTRRRTFRRRAHHHVVLRTTTGASLW